MSDQMKLPEPGTEGSWELPFAFKGNSVSLTLTEELIAQEVLDQTDVKKPARKAILRATEKRAAKALKSDFSKLSQQVQDDVRWDLFILAVDKEMGNRHLAVRNDPEIAKEIAKNFPRS